MKANNVSLYALGFVLVTACGAAVPPDELKSARDAYVMASKSDPATLAPAQLEDARQALDAAEVSFERKKDKPVTVDLSYVAWRKVQIAVAVAEYEKANREVAQAEKDLNELTSDSLERSKEQLAAMEEERRRLQAEKNKTQSELEAERKARESAEKKLSSALMSLDEMAKVKEEARGVVITLSGSVLFATAKHELLPIAQTKLDDVAKALIDQGYKKIIVEGHTDSQGSDSNNQQLSQRRAEAVRNYLVTRGITSNKIEAVGWGESRPIADNSTPEGRANNRRVEIVVTPE